jgi:hypothetical protein
MFGEILSLLGLLIVFVAPFIGIAWLIYRLIRGGKGDDYSIK